MKNKTENTNGIVHSRTTPEGAREIINQHGGQRKVAYELDYAQSNVGYWANYGIPHSVIRKHTKYFGLEVVITLVPTVESKGTSDGK